MNSHAPTIAITGATGFLGGYLLQEFAKDYQMIAWCRSKSNTTNHNAVHWIPGELANRESSEKLTERCDYLIHGALFRPGAGFRGAEGDLFEFVEKNLLGSLQLFEAAKRNRVKRVIFISTCAVHEKILSDRPLDEAHPLWATSFYGAHKAAIEKFVHVYGMGQGLCFCSLRPTGIYGVADPLSDSKWFSLIRQVAQGRDVECVKGGKEVHARDVARACRLLVEMKEEDQIRGESFNCYDQYISEFEVATIAKRLCGSESRIHGEQTSPKHQIETGKIRKLGMSFGGDQLLKETIHSMLDALSAGREPR